MQIVYGYSNCTDNKYVECFGHKKEISFQPSQKYHSLLIKGLAEAGVRVYCMSGLPINRGVTKKIFIHESDEREENSSFHYYKTINIPGLRQIMIFWGAFLNVMKMRTTQNTYAICDYLSIANTYGILLACKIKNIPIIAIVTDLTDMFKGNKWFSKINNALLKKMDGFIFLTEYMNTRINYNQKPYIVLEGHVDVSLELLESKMHFEDCYEKKVIIYAGSIEKLYGIKNLVEGFIKANVPDTELRIFGDGDYREELEEIASKHNNIRYMGNCPNREVVEQEQRAMLLVNPRPVAPEYTKYSFPSKNMEYMISGTPMLTTRLPGMPKEYYPYVYFIDDESPEGIASVLTKICNMPRKEREQKGLNARAFVLENKSNIVQAKKILGFLQHYFGGEL